jgi:predicted dehydrogenase
LEALRLGVIGCGVIGQQHLQTAAESPLIDLVAVADLRAEAARSAGARFGAGAVYFDAGDLLADERVEAVVLAMPAVERTPLALRAFAAGRHVLIEKPVALTAGHVRELIAARGALTAGCCSARFRFLESARVAEAHIAGGALGALRVVRARAVIGAGAPPKAPPPAWRVSTALNGGGILMNWGCYDLDYLLGITGWSLVPRTVLAQTWTVPPTYAEYVAPGSDAETHVAALVLCEGGTAITFERAEFAAAATEVAWQITGDRGSLRLQMTPGAGREIVYDSAEAGGVASRVIWRGDETMAPTRIGVLEDFARAVRERRPPKTSLEQALLVQQISDAIYASARQGGGVEIGQG